MSELFLEFFTEEMPSGLQSNIRENLLSLYWNLNGLVLFSTLNLKSLLFK